MSIKSTKGLVFKQLAAHLMEQMAAPGNDLPALVWVDMDKGQFDSPEDVFLPLPAIVISFGSTQWESQSSKAQQGNALLTFSIGFENYAEMYEGSVNQEIALKYWEFTEKIHTLLQGTSGERFSAMDRVQEDEYINPERPNMLICKYGYTTKLVDNSAMDGVNYVLADPDVSITRTSSAGEDPPVEDPLLLGRA